MSSLFFVIVKMLKFQDDLLLFFYAGADLRFQSQAFELEKRRWSYSHYLGSNSHIAVSLVL